MMPDVPTECVDEFCATHPECPRFRDCVPWKTEESDTRVESRDVNDVMPFVYVERVEEG